MSAYLTSAPQLITEPGDDPPSQPFDSVILSGWRTERRASDPGTFFGMPTATIATIRASNEVGVLNWLQGVDFAGSLADLKIGFERRLDGSEFLWADWETYLSGRIRSNPRRTEDGDFEIEIVYSDPGPKIVDHVFTGLQGGLLMQAGDLGSAAHDPSLDFPGGGLTIVATIKMRSPLPSGNRAIVRKAGAPTGQAYRFRFKPPDILAFDSQGNEIEAPGVISPDAAIHAVAIIDGLSVAIIAGRDAAGAQVVATGTLSSPLPASTGALEIWTAGSVGSDEMEIWQLALFEAAIDQAAAISLLDRAIQPTTADLRHLWKFNETSGASALSSLGGIDLTLTGSPPWIPTFDGHDPDDYPWSAAGQLAPAAWGQCRQLPVVSVDPRDYFVWDTEPSDGPFVSARVNGALMAEGSQYTVDLGTSSIHLVGSVGDGQITVDTYGRPAGTMTELYAEIAGEPVDSSAVLWDPEVALSAQMGEPMGRNEALQMIAASGACWHARRRDGTRVLGTWAPPSGGPAAAILGGGPRGRIRRIRERPAAAPAARIEVAYDRAGMAIREDVIPRLATTPDERALLASDWRTEDRRSAGNRRSYPESEDRRIETALVDRADALTWLGYAAELFMVPGRWVDLLIGLEEPDLDIGSIVFIQHEDERWNLIAGKLFLVTGLSIDSTEASTELYLWAQEDQ